MLTPGLRWLLASTENLFWAVVAGWLFTRPVRHRHAVVQAIPASVTASIDPVTVSTFPLPLGVAHARRLNLPPQRVGPWRPGGHGPAVPASDRCVCGEAGVTDWPAHVADAWTRDRRSA